MLDAAPFVYVRTFCVLTLINSIRMLVSVNLNHYAQTSKGVFNLLLMNILKMDLKKQIYFNIIGF